MHVDTVGCRSLDSLVLLTPSFVKNIKAKHCISGHTSSTTQLMEAGSRPTSGPCCPGQPFTRTLLPTVTKQTCPWSLAKSGRHGLKVTQWHLKVTQCVPLWHKRPRSQSCTETVEENFSLKNPGKVLKESSVKRQSPKLFRVRLEYPWATTILKLWPIQDDNRSDQRSKFPKVLSNDFIVLMEILQDVLLKWNRCCAQIQRVTFALSMSIVNPIDPVFFHSLFTFRGKNEQRSYGRRIGRLAGFFGVRANPTGTLTIHAFNHNLVLRCPPSEANNTNGKKQMSVNFCPRMDQFLDMGKKTR